MKLQLYIIVALLFIISSACRDDITFTGDTNANISLSTDTVHFDTVFNSIGSTTKQFRVYNPNDNAIKTTVQLASGSNSYFRLNIDGAPTNYMEDLEIMGHDSVYIFAEVNVDPQGIDDPMVITDSIVFVTNGNVQDVKLVAHGQDIHLIDGAFVNGTWLNDKPYLIYNSVGIDTLETLTIEAGAQIHFHNNSSMFIYGSLIVAGTQEAPVIFQGDRLDGQYPTYPGQWGYKVKDSEGNSVIVGGLLFSHTSHKNKINYAEIKNGNIGIQMYPASEINPPSNSPRLELNNTMIYNMALMGIDSYNGQITGYNNIIANCGYYCMRLMFGGAYSFYHSTFANYYPSEYGGRESEALAFNNYQTVNDTTHIYPFDAEFGNCIIYGNESKESELIIDNIVPEGSDVFNYKFDHCILKLADDYDTSDEDIFINVISDKDSLPRFIDPYLINFKLDTLSVAINKGLKAYGNAFQYDIDGNDRTIDLGPDMGAYERIINDD